MDEDKEERNVKAQPLAGKKRMAHEAKHTEVNATYRGHGYC